MSEKVSTDSNTWLLRYIVTAETAALIMLITFYATGFSDLVTHDELQIIAPYVRDRPMIAKHISKSEDVLLQLGESVQNLNMQILKSNNLLELRLQKIEKTQR